MAYLMESGYPTVGDYEVLPGMDTVGGLGWPPNLLYVRHVREGGLKGLVDDLTAAVTGKLKPTVVGPDGTVLGVAKKPKPKQGKPGVLKPATGTMTMRGPDGRMYNCTVVQGAVVGARPAPPPTSRQPAPPPTARQPAPPPTARRIGPPAPPPTARRAAPPPTPRLPAPPPTPRVPGCPPCAPAPRRAAAPAPLPSGPTVIASRPIAPAPTVITPIAPAPVPTVVPGCPPCGVQAPTVPFGPNLPARGIFGGRLPTATQFTGRPVTTSATVSVAAVPIAPTRPGTQMPAAWSNVVRTPISVVPVIKPRRLDPAFMVGPW